MANNQFREFIAKATAAEGQLGLTHVTDVARMLNVLKGGSLEARHCKVFGENLVYLFYGRPAYRQSWDGGATSNLDHARVCFILRDDVAANAHRILPFDSGGFERYRAAFHETLEIADFELSPGGHPLEVIGAFYHSLADYYWMEPIRSRTFPASQNLVRSYHQLITGGLNVPFDDRCAAIEIQLANSVPLKGEVLALIGPNALFDDEVIMTRLNEWGAEPRGYRIPSMFNPSEISGRLFDEVARFLEDQKWL